MTDRFLRRAWFRPRLVLLFSCAAIVTGVTVAAAYPVLTGRTTPPAVLALEARRAVERAREAGAGEWAPELLQEAESGLRASRAEARRQELRWLPFRDFRRARGTYDAATAAAKRAEDAAVEARRDASSRATARVAEVERALNQVAELTRGMRLEESESRALRVARLRLTEARIHAETGSYRSAERLAGEAFSHVRRGAERVGSRAARYVDESRVRQWRAWEESTIAWSRKHRAAAMVVNKDQNRLTLYVGGRLERTFRADMGQNHFDAKLQAGDGATPEGRYRITRKKGKGRSKYYKALELDYPNADDRKRYADAVRGGHVRRGAGAGSLIEIHGHGGRGEDWTRGCIALSNRDIDYLFDVAKVGTPVTIIGGDGRGGRFSSMVSRLSED